MINKLLIATLVAGLFGTTVTNKYYGSTTAAVTLAGAVIKSKHTDESSKKYKRKDCPVCKGKGWYMSGDGIKKIDCNYCEPEVATEPVKAESEPTTPSSSQTITKPHILRR